MVEPGNLPIDPNRQVAPSETSQQSVNHGIKLTEARRQGGVIEAMEYALVVSADVRDIRDVLPCETEN